MTTYSGVGDKFRDKTEKQQHEPKCWHKVNLKAEGLGRRKEKLKNVKRNPRLNVQ